MKELCVHGLPVLVSGEVDGETVVFFGKMKTPYLANLCGCWDSEEATSE